MPNFGSKPCSRCIARLGSLQRLNMGFGKNHTVNAEGKARHKSKRSRTGAGAPVPTPCSPRARRFRRARPLSCTPYRTGAADTATPAALPAEIAMQTNDTAQAMQPQPFEVAPASPPPPQPPILPRLPMPNARVRTLGSDCAGWVAARGHLVKWLRRTCLLEGSRVRILCVLVPWKTSPRRAAKKKGTTCQKWAVATARVPVGIVSKTYGLKTRHRDVRPLALRKWLRRTCSTIAD